MKTKNIFKTLALAMLMPTMLLTTACSSEDDLTNNTLNSQPVAKKGYALPVTVNVSREGDKGSNRAAYNESTRTLEFSTGDKLFVSGTAGGYDYEFAGTLEYDTESEKFSGTIYVNPEWSGTFKELLAAVMDYEYLTATLLPAGYEDYGFLTIDNNGTDEKYDDSVDFNFTYTLATSKAAGVEQFSYEEATEYNNGFALVPRSTILNFTITGLAANTNVDVALTGNTSAYNITRTVTTDASGTATFAAGIYGGASLNLFSLTVGGNAITLPTKDAEVGKIYNITRAAAAAATVVDLSTISGDTYTVTGDVILTGTPTESPFDIKYGGDDYEVTLDNVNSAGSKQVSVAGNNHNMNIKLKGTSRLKEIFTRVSDKTVTIGEAAAGGTLILTGSENPIRAKSFTINGGTVKSQATGDNWAVYLNNSVGVLTINGGALYLAAGQDGTKAVYGSTISGTLYGWNGSAWVTYTNQRYATTDNTSGDPTAWTW